MRSTVPPDDPSFCWWRSLLENKPPPPPAMARALREMERLAAASVDSMDDLRHRLLTYKAGDLWFPAGGISRQDTDIPPVITLLLLGFSGVGKSSLVNLLYSALGRSGFVPFAHTSSPAGELAFFKKEPSFSSFLLYFFFFFFLGRCYSKLNTRLTPLNAEQQTSGEDQMVERWSKGKDGRTLCLEEHNVLRSMKSGFCVFDSPGLDYASPSEGFKEVSHWVEDGVRHRQPCNVSSSSSTTTSTSSSSSEAAGRRFLRRRVNCAVVVASLSELRGCLDSGHLQALDATRQLFQHPSIRESCNDAPILILTHGDELTPDKRIETRVAVCEYLGMAETGGVYDVPCLNEHGVHIDEYDPVTTYAVAEAAYRALVVADRCHPPRPGFKDWLFVVMSWAMCALSAFFAFLSCCCSKLAKLNRDYQKMR